MLRIKLVKKPKTEFLGIKERGDASSLVYGKTGVISWILKNLI